MSVDAPLECHGWNFNCNSRGCPAGGANVRKYSRDHRVSLLLLQGFALLTSSPSGLRKAIVSKGSRRL